MFVHQTAIVMLFFVIFCVIVHKSETVTTINDAVSGTVTRAPKGVMCGEEHKCLPTFIIAGTQKSGTTALAAHLAKQESISFAARKELHFFDKTSQYNKGLAEYMRSFYVWNTTHRQSPPLYGEATPFYIASRLACGRIAREIPTIKMIIMLRDPVKRAYSEYQMKKRRVEQQSEFFAVITKHQGTIITCIEKHTSNFTALRECAPPEVGNHPRWVKLRMVLSKQFDKMNDWSQVVDTCFPAVRSDSENVAGRKQLDSATVDCSISRQGATTGNSSICLMQQSSLPSAESGRYVSVTPRMSGLAPASTYFNRSVAHTLAHRLLLPQRYRLAAHRDHLLETSMVPAVALAEKSAPTSSGHPTPTVTSATTGTIPPGVFDPRSCWGALGDDLEVLRPLEEAFVGEIEGFRTCGGEALSKLTEKQFGRHSMSEDDFASSLSALDSIVSRCVQVRTGISSQYFYRSLYAAQLFHCFKSIPREQFLILPSERLRRHPQTTVREVLRFIGAEEDDNDDNNSGSNSDSGSGDANQETVQSVRAPSPSTVIIPTGRSDNDEKEDDDDIHSVIQKQFPVFERSTGWRLNSEYEPLPEHIQSYMEAFYAPFNALLFRLLDDVGGTAGDNRVMEAEWG